MKKLYLLALIMFSLVSASEDLGDEKTNNNWVSYYLDKSCSPLSEVSERMQKYAFWNCYRKPNSENPYTPQEILKAVSLIKSKKDACNLLELLKMCELKKRAEEKIKKDSLEYEE